MTPLFCLLNSNPLSTFLLEYYRPVLHQNYTVRKALPSLFSEALPFVLSHQDLNTMNLLVNPESGNITCIVNWAESRILPFGFTLYGIEKLLSWMDSEGWHYYDHHANSRVSSGKHFRRKLSISDTNLYLIPSARMAGLFYRYGFVFGIKGEVQSVRVNQFDGSLAYLHAFCTYAERSPISWATKASWSDIMSRFSKLPDFQE